LSASGFDIVTFLSESSGTFLASRPEWTLVGAVVGSGGGAFTIDHAPFRWIDGRWETETVLTKPNQNGAPLTRVVLRISPDTLRRWKDVGINPFLEACAQLEEYLRISTRHGHLTALTLL
jgi:hypothetical protein